MAQEPSSKDLLEAVKQQESGGRRYKADGKTLLEGPQTKYGTAKGEMQVLDMTNKDPGFGVRPASDDSPDERARVGEDYLAAMVNRYGDKKTALIAYNWGPGNTDNWLKKGADPAKLPAETQNYVAKITGSLGSTKVAQTSPQAKPSPKSGIQRAVYKAAPLSHPMLSQLGPNFQAAMAVSMLADEGEKEGKSEYEPSEAEKMLTEATARPVALAQADLGYQSPFPEPQKQQPIKMAAGGLPFAPSAKVRPSARAELDAIKAEYDAYAPKASEYNTALEKYNAEQLNPYQTQVDAYNAALEKYNTEIYNPYSAAVDKYNADYAAYEAKPKAVGISAMQEYLNLLKSQPVAPAEFSMAAPVAPKEFSMVAPTGPSVSQEVYNAKMAAAKADVERRQVALNAAINPEAYGLSMPKLFADGGQVSAPYGGQVSAPYGGPVYRASGSPDTGEYFQDPMGVADSGPVTADTFAKGKDFKAADALQAVKEVGKGMARSGRAIAQGVSETPYNLVGGVADVGNMVLTPFGLGSKEPTLGSEHLKRLALEAGIRQAPPTDPRDKGFYTMGELGASIVNPGPIAAKGGKAAEMLAKDFQAYNRALGPAGVAYAVKPRGGTALTSGSIDKPPISKIDKTIEQWFERTARDAPDVETTKALRDFLDKKGRKYLTTELGTGADPIRTAMASGEIQPVGSDVARFPEYLLHAARTLEAPGHSAAKRDLESLYDRASTVEGRVVGMHDPADGDARRRFNELVRQSEANAANAMTQEGVPRELQNPSIQGVAGSDLEASYTANLMSAVNAPQEFPAIAGAVQRGQPIYDLGYQGTYMDMFSPKTVAENINAIPVNKLKNMSFADAMIEGSKLMEVSRNYDKAVDLVAKGAVVPKEVVMQFTKPVTETGNGQWVQLTDKMATKMEGKMLHHSVGGYADSSTYGHGGSKGFDAGDAKVWSLRDPKTGLANVTVEGKRLDDGRTEITQIKGDFNSFPGRYTNDIFNFFDHMGYKIIPPKNREYYRNSPTGQALEDPFIIDWGDTYIKWVQNKDVDVSNKLPPPPGQIDIPFAKGGMVERQPSTARYI